MSADPRIRAAAAALANARSARRGAPAISNVLELLERTLPDLYRNAIEDAQAALAAADALDWRPIGEARKDGTAVLAFGIHAGCPADALRPGDFWWAIILWDVWHVPHRWVFSKNGAPTWSEPLLFRELTMPAEFRRSSDG